MEKIIYQWCYSNLKMGAPEILQNYHIFEKKYNCSINNNNPTACGITSCAIINKIQNYFGGEITIDSLTKAKEMVIQNNNVVINLGIDSYHSTSWQYFFPGHAIIIIPLGSQKYMVLQSYINRYSLSEWMDNNKLVYKKEEIIELIDFFMMFNLENKLSLKMITNWFKFTKVPIMDMLESPIINKNGLTSCIILDYRSSNKNLKNNQISEKISKIMIYSIIPGVIIGYLLSKKDYWNNH